MNERNRVLRERGKVGRVGMAPVAATMVLVGVVMIVGAVGYVAINAMADAGTSSSTVQSCAPTSAPQCVHAVNSTAAIVPAGVSAEALGK